MINETPAIATIAHAIQLAVAPVFLLTGVASILGVLAGRLGRIIDRSRVLHALLQTAPISEHADYNDELLILARRSRLANMAIGLCIACFLLICSVIAILFMGSFIKFNVAGAIALLFIVAMLLLISALICMMREVLLATAHVQILPKSLIQQ